jgi:hypothetical protein
VLSRRVRPVAVAVTVVLALLAAGCGGSPGNHVARLATTTTQTASASSPSGGGSNRDWALSYAGCLRAHGVASWPDPNSAGVFDKSKLTLQQLGVSGSRLQAAQATCRHLLPNGGQPPGQARQAQIRAQTLAFARCIRSHGVPNFPDPGSDGRLPDPASEGIDQGSPKFQAANQACGKYRPPYFPSNSAYDAWARAHPGQA